MQTKYKKESLFVHKFNDVYTELSESSNYFYQKQCKNISLYIKYQK